MDVESARAAFDEAFHVALVKRKEWERREAVAAKFQERAFAAKIDYYEAAKLLDDARDAWNKAEKEAKK